MSNFTCFRWLFWRMPSTPKSLNQVRPRSLIDWDEVEDLISGVS